MCSYPGTSAATLKQHRAELILTHCVEDPMVQMAHGLGSREPAMEVYTFHSQVNSSFKKMQNFLPFASRKHSASTKEIGPQGESALGIL